ncbi:COG1470 family protein [Saccharicrinis fermentans]|uniref:NPCBM-associated, NEW3 domain of alpha-galactosidase n=1 Tax=Saccharicrinis fermentans DSM 9555 = JCM 21142 TaxID=869213 RepID=W7Y1D9_9BACT|nr:NEW3 domain-containing protein [Saccharicrinis fermentans]GAF01782.1 NPCBM-associated, NEW3 domain of alpha-galactosidase [Saccharicrinis fermentans DSM 9555 = JCM 21142]
MRRKSYLMLLSVLAMITMLSQPAHAEGDVEVYTANTKISVPPGESLSYKLQIINNSEQTKLCNLYITGIPRSWDYSLKSGAYSVKQIAVLPGEKQSVDLKVEVPLKVNKGNYPITVKAGEAQLPLVVNITQQGSNKTEFTTEQANMQGHSKADFSFKADLRNRTGEKQLYALRSNAPKGWRVTFKPNYKQATSVEIEPNASKDVTIEVKPPHSISAGTYQIPVKAVNNFSSAELELEVVIEGTYEMEVTTPTGLLSADITAGSTETIDLLVKNTGSSPLNKVKMSASKPSGWEVTFKPEEIEEIAAGKNASVKATIKAAKKSIAGDYLCNITAKVPEVTDKISFRMAVKTPAIWGWLGIVVIVGAIAGVAFLFRKYGRR